jgi:hypothetical protein
LTIARTCGGVGQVELLPERVDQELLHQAACELAVAREQEDLEAAESGDVSPDELAALIDRTRGSSILHAGRPPATDGIEHLQGELERGYVWVAGTAA